MKRIILVLTAILATFLVSRYVFEPTNLYYEFFWLDIPMHVLGGYLIGLLLIAFSAYKKKSLTLRAYLLLLLVVMTTWEIYEYVRGVVAYEMMSDYFDTLQDFVFGYIGAFFAYKNKR